MANHRNGFEITVYVEINKCIIISNNKDYNLFDNKSWNSAKYGMDIYMYCFNN